MVGMDKGILKRIKDSEQEYHGQVTKFLKEKENELKSVLRKLEEKNLNTDGKDMIIKNLRDVIQKIESDGLELSKQLKREEHRLRAAKERNYEECHDKAFMKESLKNAKLKCRTQQSLLANIQNENTHLKAAVTVKDKEIKTLELKLLRMQSIAHPNANGTTKASGDFDRDEEEGPGEETVPKDSVLITQRGQQLASENKDSVYNPYTQNAKFETFLDDVFHLKLGKGSTRRQI